MFDTIAENQAFDRVLVTSFYKEQIVRFNKIAQGSVAIGASQQEVTEAFLKYHLLGGRYYQPLAQTFQMPTHFKGIDLTSSRFIKWLNDMNIIPGYYGVNSINLMNDKRSKTILFTSDSRPNLSGNFKYVYDELLRQKVDFDYDIKRYLRRILRIDVNGETSLDCHIYLVRLIIFLSMISIH